MRILLEKQEGTLIQEPHFATQCLDHLGVVAGICKDINLIEQIDHFVGPTERKVSVGEAVQAMVLNALGFVGRPLYLMKEFYRNKPLDLLIRSGLEAEHLNDDSLGRALDRLYQAGLTEGFAQVSSHALQVYHIDHETIHLDSSTFSLQGAYESEEEQAIEVTHGYSKDKRADLKQVLVNLICNHQGSIPLWIEALSGNGSDAKSFPETIKAYVEQLRGSSMPYFVADSALYSKDNLEALTSIKWISRVPATIKEAKRLLRETDTGAMQSIEETEGYRFREHRSTYADVAQRWVVIFSEKAHRRQMKTFERKRASEREQAQKDLQRLGRRTFACRADAQEAAEELAASWRYHQLEVETEPIMKYARPGRPRAGAQPTIMGHRVAGTLLEDEEAVRVACQKNGKFIVATNELDRQALPASKLLSLYKAQAVTVERGFRFLKDPLFFAESLFLKRPGRLMALVMVMGLALLIYSLAERKLRRALKKHNQTLPNQVGKPTQRPTMRRIFQMFEGIHVLLITDGDGLHRKIVNLRPVHRKIIELLGENVKNCYYPRE